MSTKAFMNELDRNKLHEKLYLYFNLEQNYSLNEDKIAQLIKHEMTHIETMRKLINYTGFEIEEFIYHCIALYPQIFTRIFIKKVKNNIKKHYTN